MGEITGISWCDHTFNPWWGCTKVSPGCEHCYAETFTHRMGMSLWGPVQRRYFGDKHWNEPLKWNKEAALEGKQHRVFCASMADVFEKFEGLDAQRLELWNLVVKTPYLEWLILTKRPENISAMIPHLWLDNPPDHIRLGVTAEDQPNADRRIPELLRVWHGKNFVSYEPAIGPLHMYGRFWPIDWIICGGESGPGCRPMELEWARHIQSQCKNACIPFFFKQIGGYPDKRHDPDVWPEDLRIREFPEVVI